MTPGSEFRRDVQGLRGVAVGLVVLEHATRFVPGGYVGVDVFFVISGFVITRLLLREEGTSGSVSLRDFYSRRIRRLIPALAIVLVATLVLSAFILAPGLEQDKAVWAALSSFFFVANIRYILEGGYFFLQADPFRHLWSLGVEEQFYAVYPFIFLAVIGISRKTGVGRRKLLVITLASLSAISLLSASLLALGQVLPFATRLSFFGTPFRFWELLAGALVAIVLENREPRINRVAQVVGQGIGCAAILWPALAYGPFTLFPGLAALPPVLGTALLIVVGSAHRSVPNAGSVRPLVYLGDISYGLYLWHWPLIVFAERLFPDAQFAPLAAVALSVVLADRQLRLVEDPIRRRADVTGRRAVRLLSATSVVVVLVGGIVFVGSKSGLGLDATAQFERLASVSESCSFVDGRLAAADECSSERGDGERILLIGDSQAAALSDGIVLVADQIGASYRLAFGNSCPVHLRPNEIRPDCAEIQDGFRRLVDEFRPSVVVVANASDLYVTRGGFGKPDTRIRSEDGSLPANYQEALENWVSGVRGVLDSPALRPTPVLYVQMIPPAPVRAPTLARPGANTDSFPLSGAFDRNMIVEEERRALADLPNVKTLDPSVVLCPDGRCLLFGPDGPVYADLYHLNARGAELLAPEIKRLIQFSVG